VNEKTIPVACLTEAMQAVASDGVKYRQAFNYGGPDGSANLVESLRRFLTESTVERNRLIIGPCGATSILDFASMYGVELPVNAGFETIAGYMLSELGHIPRAGERVEFEGRRFTVTAMERNRIAKVGVEKISAVAEPKGESQLAGN